MASSSSPHSSSPLNLEPEELKAVELTRQRLYQLTNSIGSLRARVLQANPLPDLGSLQASADVLQSNLRSLLAVLAAPEQQAFLARLVVHPSANYPGREAEHVLVQLLRKKPEPEVDVAMEEGRRTFAEVRGGGGEGGEEAVVERLAKRWNMAMPVTQKVFEEYVQEGQEDPYTADEREVGVENVRTGLRRALEEFESDDEDDEQQQRRASAATGRPPGPAGGAGGGDEDLVMLDRAPPPLPLEGSQTGPAKVEDEGFPLENLLRIATRGELESI